MSNLTTDSILELSRFANILADDAREVSLRYFRQEFEIESKEDQSPVTFIDRKIESHLADRIAELYPEHGFLGEEFGRHGEDREHLWVVDPIDGTRSFISGNPLFGTL
ncbi:MAG: inositol monophosphatase family protein, partial [Arenicellales bacterium]|nr:inositol monophosphatase family protein [Arenicellales bacterium]